MNTSVLELKWFYDWSPFPSTTKSFIQNGIFLMRWNLNSWFTLLGISGVGIDVVSWLDAGKSLEGVVESTEILGSTGLWGDGILQSTSRPEAEELSLWKNYTLCLSTEPVGVWILTKNHDGRQLA